MKKKLIFVPTYCYSSHPIFFNIAKLSKEKFYNIHFNVKDPFLLKWQKNSIQKENLLEYFDEYLELTDEYDPLLSNYLNQNKSHKIKEFLLFVYHLKIYKHLLEQKLNALKPDAILTTTDSSRSAMIVNSWAEVNKIPFIIIQPTFIDPKIPKLAIRLKRKIFYLLFNKLLNIPFMYKQHIFGNEKPNNHLFLWGDAFKISYKNLKIEKNISITGNPAFDSFIQKKDVSVAHKIGLDIPENTPIITICTEIIKEVMSKKAALTINNICKETITENPEWFFIIKLHPREKIDQYVDLFKNILAKNFIITKDIDLYDIFKITDVQISVNSYSSFEAVAFGIPIILIKNDLIKTYDYFNNEIELRANSMDSLTSQIRKCLTNEYKSEFELKRPAFLNSRLYKLDNNSSKRAVEKIEEIIKSSNEKNIFI